jgi:hypothetical protein
MIDHNPTCAIHNAGRNGQQDAPQNEPEQGGAFSIRADAELGAVANAFERDRAPSGYILPQNG